ncbi:hypothetical protein AArcSl_1626 [Halalkaliarchaeum desulfuricum]|uniref:Uncharacterized protein n=1 Tax=Halalkaliarchaeum desulfuricum TaxID=2055893 RepID=A0A343TJI3_9EURY|nr:hypothetical protein [Halalkaliarchaeum desulfuricum]AUX09255.1 hypothetical protein AArcSl_1626 [Halalkaliarchaeum desulfuricum]
MNTTVFPVPIGESVDFGTDEIIETYIREDISPRVFDEETLFLVLLIGENPGNNRDHIRDQLLENQKVKYADQFDKIDITVLGEQRLNDFAVSLLYNCMDTDPGRDPREIINDETIITDDVRRKIEFYLPRIHERIEAVESQLISQFQNRQKELFPVDANSNDAQGLFKTLDDDIVSDDPIVDYVLVAGAALESRRDTRNIVEYIRENGLDDAGILSKIRGSGGYQRIFTNIYSRQRSDFFPRFTEAMSLYEDGITEVQTLSQLYTAPNYRDVYNLEYEPESLLLHRFSGSSQQLGRYVLEAALISRIISQNEDDISDDYESTRSDLTDKIDKVRELQDDIDELNEWFDGTKITYNAKDPADQASGLVTEVNKTNNTILKFLFGVNRSNRTSVFTTVTRHLEEERQNLSSNIGSIRGHVDQLKGFESELNEILEDIDETYSEIDSTTVAIEDLPSQSTFKQHIKEEWDTTVEEVSESLSMVDVSKDQSEFRNDEREWGETLQEADKDLNELRNRVSKLEDIGEHAESISNERSKSEEKLAAIDQKLGGDT